MSRPKFSRNDSPIDVILKLSRYYGSDKKFVIGGGGNTSVKIGNDRLFVKASGIELGNIDESGFVELDRKKLDEILRHKFSADRMAREEEYKNMILDARIKADGLRPSVESIMHHLLPQRFVVHTHNQYVNMLSCCTKGWQLCKELFGDNVLWVDFTDPGVELAQTLNRAVSEYCAKTKGRMPEAIIIQNHGLVIGGDTPEEIFNRTDNIVNKIKSLLPEKLPAEPFGKIDKFAEPKARRLIEIIAPVLRGLLAENSEMLAIVNFDDGDDAIKLACGDEGRDVALGGPLYPDNIVYSKSFPVWIEIDSEDENEIISSVKKHIEEYVSKREYSPAVVIVKGLGIFFAGNNVSRTQLVRDVYNDVINIMAGAKLLGGINYLVPEQYQFLENWEVEAYRLRALKGASSPAGRVGGKVAVITGSARGVGAEIADNFASEGGYVVLADINKQGVQERADRLCDKFGTGIAIGLQVDVTNVDSVADMIYNTVRVYGGLDVLISNAGVLKADSVKTQPIEDFDFVTAVNYKGYFVCTQKSASVMSRQHKANPKYWSDIIQINSKSGLQGSNKNGAYAGSKFGGIGLTQSFALELVADGIKVNSICPGNFLDSPLWSDPENGLFVQYLKAGKVPGAKDISDVRKFYEDKVPMKRGCRISDLMKAIYYVIEQKYETGQAVPVTGGQVMLK